MKRIDRNYLYRRNPDRERGRRNVNVLGQQMSGSIPDGATSQNTVIAYEPVWAIGTGLVPTLDQIDEAHRFMRAELLPHLVQMRKTSVCFMAVR